MEKYLSELSAKTGIDPATLAALLAFIAQMVQMCFPKPAPTQLVANTFGNRIRLAMAMRDNGIRPLSTQGKALTTAIFEDSVPTEALTEFAATYAIS